MRAPDIAVLQDLPATVHRCDADGRLTGDAPHLYILRAPGGLICRSHTDLPDALVFELAELLARPRGRPSAWETEVGDLIATLGQWAPVASFHAGPVYRFAEDLPEADSVILDRKDARLLQAELPEWAPLLETEVPMAAVLAGGRAVSICASVRASQSVHCAGVETAPRHRGQGHAARAVLGWARQVRAQGAEPSYETTFDNLSSQAVAARLGLRAVASALAIRCARPEPQGGLGG